LSGSSYGLHTSLSDVGDVQSLLLHATAPRPHVPRVKPILDTYHRVSRALVRLATAINGQRHVRLRNESLRSGGPTCCSGLRSFC
jgi:hypothetical protein